MKTIHYAILLATLMTAVSCGTTLKFPVSTIVPAAEGKVTITKDKNYNYIIALDVKYLANADRLTPAKKYYVVWLMTPNGTNLNLGMLMSDKKNNASLKSLSSSKPLQIFVTAEDYGNVSMPGNEEIFRTPDFNLK